MKRKRIYLAGPDVFFKDPATHFAMLMQLCADRGLEGVPPSDGGLSAGFKGSGEEIAERIYQANIALIQGADGVLANLMPFRGPIEPDPGTVFECGFAVALGKPVAGYLIDVNVPYENKVVQHHGMTMVDGKPFDQQFGLLVESFNQPLNLMLTRSSGLFATAEQALDSLALRLGVQAYPTGPRAAAP